jgi:6-phosphogluconolactonase (cycloisomerase 2 family)
VDTRDTAQDDNGEPRNGAPVSRRGVMAGATALAMAASAAEAATRQRAGAGKVLAYVGTYTPNGEGIYLFEMNPADGRLSRRKVFANIRNPTWLAFAPSGQHLYAVNETQTFDGAKTGAVSAFAVDRDSGDLTLLNSVGSGGAGPAHCSVHPSGRFVFVANYGGGSIAVLPVQADGRLGEASDVQHDPGPPGATRAADAPPGSFAISDHDGPHAHMVQTDPAGRFVLSNDLGLDRTFLWKFDQASGKLSPNDPPFVAASSGAGPRHFAFHPDGRVLYNLHEEASTLAVYDYDPERGTLKLKQTLPTLPAGFTGTNFTSEVVVSRDARFLYVGNRLHNTIAIFAIGAGGRLKWVGEEWTRGDYTRNIALDPSGRFMFACNHRSDQITCFRVDPQKGTLTFTGQYEPVGSPAVIVFAT